MGTEHIDKLELKEIELQLERLKKYIKYGAENYGTDPFKCQEIAKKEGINYE